MPNPSKSVVDPLAQFDFLLSALKRQLEEAQRTAEELKQHRDAASSLGYPTSNACELPQPEQGTTGTKVEEAQLSECVNENIEPNPDEQMQPPDTVNQSLEQKIFAKLLEHKNEIQSFLSKEVDRLDAAKRVKKTNFRDSTGSDEAEILRVGSIAESVGPQMKKVNSNMPQFHQEYHEDHPLNEGGFKMKTYLVSFTVLFSIYAVIAILGFTVFDMHHEDEPWRYFATEEVWDQKGVSKWSSSYTGILHNMALPDFQKFVCVINWITVLYLGFGSEALVGVYLLTTLGHEVLEELWLIAQFCFPLLISMAFQFAGEHNPWSYLFFIVGMWKFCFPETLFYLTRAMSFEHGVLQFAADVCNGIGTMMHHGSSALLLCLIQSNMLMMTQVALSVIVPLILQHLIALLKYQSIVLYAILELTLEIIWEREVFSIMQNTTGTPWFAWMGTQGLLFAHWLYWLAVPLQGFADLLKSKETLEEEAETQGDEIARFQTAINVGEGAESRKSFHERKSERKSREARQTRKGSDGSGKSP